MPETLKEIIAAGKVQYADDPDAATWSKDDWITWARSQQPKKGKTVHTKADKDLSEEKEEVTSSSAPS